MLKKKGKLVEVSFSNTEPQYSVPAPAEYAELKTVPQDIHRFFEKILPNLKKVLHNMKVPPWDIENVLGNFAIHIFDTNSRGVHRYETYNPVKYPGITYFSWFIAQMKYSILAYRSEEKAKSNATAPLSLNAIEFEWGDNSMELHELIPTPQLGVFETIEINKLPEYILQYHQAYKEEGAFETHVYELFQSRLNREKKSDFAARKGLHNSTITLWMSKLENLISDYFNGDYDEFEPITT